MKDLLLSIWNSPFWNEPVSAFVVPVCVISYFLIEHYLEKRALRLSRAVFASGWGPVKGTEYRHRFLPWRTCRMCYTSNSPNDKFMPSVVIDVERGGIVELPAHVFRFRYREIENANSSDSTQAADS